MLTLLGGRSRVAAPIERMTRATPASDAERSRSRADRDLLIATGALRAFAVNVDRLAVRSNASWETICASLAVADAAKKLETMLLAEQPEVGA